MQGKTEKVTPKVLSGFMELLPAEQILFNKMLDVIKQSYELFGFIPLNTPIIERAEVLLAKGGEETDRQIYRLTKGESELALRFDLTVPLARYVAQHYSDLQFPFRRYHIGKVYRGERTQRGRYREFYQCDIDIVGNGKLSIINDAEIPSVIYETFRRLGFESFTIRINNRKIFNGFFYSLGINEQATNVLRVIDKIDKVGLEEVQKELFDLGLITETVKKIIAFINIKGDNTEIINQLRNIGINNELFVEGINELESVVGMINRFGVPEANFSIDLTIARGLDYYTGTVYETVLNDYSSIGSVCSGGRYDNLAECYTDKEFPGVGISIGFTRLFSRLLEARVIKPSNSTPAQVMVIPLDNQLDKAIDIASKLRRNGISTFVYLENAKPPKMFKTADRLKIPFAVIIGGNEAAENLLSLKNMETNEQKKITVEQAIEVINKKRE